MDACSLEWPNGSICQPIRGRPHSPKVSFKNLSKYVNVCSILNPLLARQISCVPHSPSHLIDNIVVVSPGFVVHAPAAINEFETAFFD